MEDNKIVEMPRLARWRTIDNAYADLKETDPDTCISKNYLRRLVKCDFIKNRKNGKRIYVELNDMYEILKNPPEIPNISPQKTICSSVKIGRIG